MNFSQIECESFCINRNQRLPSVLDFDFGNMDFKSILKQYDSHNNVRPNIWTDGKFNYTSEKWMDAFGKPIPDTIWENSVWLRKANFRSNKSHFMVHIIWPLYHMIF